MTRTKQFIYGAMLAPLIFSGCVAKSAYLQQVKQADSLKSQRDALQNDLNGLQQQKNALDQNLAAAKDENAKLLDSLNAKKGELSQRVAELTKQNQDLAQQARDAEQAKEAAIAKMKSDYDQLVGGLQEQVNAGQIQIKQLAGRLSVNMVDKILFDSGQSIIKPEGQKVLQKVGDVLKGLKDKDIRIEGYTDNVPISSALRDKFASNWELSTARATSVVRYLEDKVGIDPQRLIAAGYGENRPVAPNTTPEGRQQNRRIEIVLVPSENTAGTTATPPAVSSGTAPSTGTPH